MTNDLMNDVEDLIDKERASLLKGDFESLSRMAIQKEVLIGKLMTDTLDAGESTEFLKRKIIRNQELLESAMSGIRDVTGRMKELEKVRNTLETYDSLGKKKSISPNKTKTMERRA